MLSPEVLSLFTTRILVCPPTAVAGTVTLIGTAVAGTQFMLATAPLVNTFSPASVKSPSWLKSMNTAKPLV